MHDIEKIRIEIDQIHNELARLFKQRLVLTRKIWEIKKVQKMSFVDPKRESEIIHRFDESIKDVSEQKAIQSFFKCILAETKTYLEEKLK